jgi:Flp pilus assembly protein TadG
MINIKRESHRGKRRGAALVEMALVLPIFVAVTLGIVEFGRAMMVGNLVTNAAREGARLAIIDGSTNSEVQTAVTDFLQAAVGVAPADVTITIDTTAYPGNPDPADQVANCNPRDLVTISVQVPYNKVSYIKPQFLNGKQLRGSASMRHE